MELNKMEQPTGQPTGLNKTHIGPLKLEDVITICNNPRPFDQWWTKNMGGNFLKLFNAPVQKHGFIAYHNEVPVACVLCIEVIQGVWEVCMTSTPNFNKVATILAKYVRRNTIPKFKALGARRAQISMPENSPKEYHLWATRWLGATQEGVLGNFAIDGTDILIYGRIF